MSDDRGAPMIDQPALLAARDALAAELVRHRQEHEPSTGSAKCACGEWAGPYTMHTGAGSWAHHIADALLATVVRDVATLAADETLVVVSDEHQWHGGYYCTCGEALNSPRGFSYHVGYQVATALAAALGGDRPAPTTEEQP